MITNALINEFRLILGPANVLDQEADRFTYSYDGTPLEPVIPALVIRPETGDQLARAIKLCNDNNLPATHQYLPRLPPPASERAPDSLLRETASTGSRSCIELSGFSPDSESRLH